MGGAAVPPSVDRHMLNHLDEQPAHVVAEREPRQVVPRRTRELALALSDGPVGVFLLSRWRLKGFGVEETLVCNEYPQGPRASRSLLSRCSRAVFARPRPRVARLVEPQHGARQKQVRVRSDPITVELVETLYLRGDLRVRRTGAEQIRRDRP
jgi:hypothetical protein